MSIPTYYFKEPNIKNIDCKHFNIDSYVCNAPSEKFEPLVYTISPMRLQALSPQRQQEKANWVPSTLTLFRKKEIN